MSGMSLGSRRENGFHLIELRVRCRAGGKDLESAEHERLKIEVWDHRLHLHHFRGGCSLVLRDIIDHQRIQNTLRLTGVSSGEISLEVSEKKTKCSALPTSTLTHRPWSPLLVLMCDAEFGRKQCPIE